VTAFQRVVFDTSTLVSAALRVGSIPHQAMVHALSTGELCASASTLAELAEVLMRSKFDRYQTPDVRQAFVDFVLAHSAVFDVSEIDIAHVNPSCRDPKDNQFLALVRGCEADALVSSDADLLDLHPWNGVPILTPSGYLKYF
jgi:putative PIN family toxin of toxin-antitoxin system